MRLALFQPDIPQNLGAALRLGACLEVAVDVIEPCAFPLSNKSLKRAALDYGSLCETRQHAGWSDFLAAPERFDGRLVLFTTKASQPFQEFTFEPGDTLLFGQESAGAPDHVHAAAQARLFIPIAPQARSLNVVAAAAMALGVALTQSHGFPSREILV
jgi:tRNA (cytidine/uridine-2'-O-)-methyltransferase